MASEQAKQMAQRYASVRERTSKPDLDLATRRDIDESLHSVAREPERVSFAEVDADGVPALWCIPEGSDAEHVLLHSHAAARSSSRCTPIERRPGTSPGRRGFGRPRTGLPSFTRAQVPRANR